MTSYWAATRYDSVRYLTELYCGDFGNLRIVRHDIDWGGGHAAWPLPLPYGIPWVAQDLDGDGQIELVIQDGDYGFGGDGWIDIRSAPDWHMRSHIVFPGMKTEMDAQAVNVDADPQLELYVTPSSFGGGNAWAVIIDYDSLADSFTVASAVPAPPITGGVSAIADFDGDGRIEFVTAYDKGYSIFEWQGTGLAYIGPIGQVRDGGHTCAVPCRPFHDGQLDVLIGHGYGSKGWQFELMEPTGDNSFGLAHLFAETTGYIGITPCSAVDFDCDGLDELVMDFHPNSRVWEWSDAVCDFVQGCVWGPEYGSLARFYSLDVDQNGIPEFSAINSSDRFIDFAATSPIFCDTAPVCVPCACPCAADPSCDSVRTDIEDVIQTINVAFRASPAVTDPACPRERTDLDCSGATDVIDVVNVINVAFRGDPADSVFCNPCP